MTMQHTYDAVVVGGGPAGTTVAADLATLGRSVLLLDRAGRIKPCGGAIPPRLIRDFAIPDELLVAKARGARIVAPSERYVDMAIDNDFVGMVDREVFDEWLRVRAADLGAERRSGTFEALERDSDGTALVIYREPGAYAERVAVRARHVVGADGANSAVARAALPDVKRPPFVFAYHEIVELGPETPLDQARCDIYYDSRVSPDFYAWVFPHGNTASIGTGTAHKGFGLKEAVSDLRARTGLDRAKTLRREGAPLPLKPMKRWDNGRDVIVVGDAAGLVAPASGEGIYYAMASARFVATAVDQALLSGDSRALAVARKRFMRAHGTVFFILRIMQKVWYASDSRRERFVSICRDPDVQRLTWTSYLNKEMGRPEPLAHLKIMLKDFAHLFGVISPWGRRASGSQEKTGV